MKVIILNAFSLNMLPEGHISVKVSPMTLQEVIGEIGFYNGEIESHVGHADTAAIFSTLLGIDVPCVRDTVKLDPHGDFQAIAGQYSGPRLPEGCKNLPAGATIKWFHVSVWPQ